MNKDHIEELTPQQVQEQQKLSASQSAYQQRVDELNRERLEREQQRKRLYERIAREQHAEKMKAELKVKRDKHKREMEEARAKLKNPKK
jgi:hypothetical protein